MRCDECKTDPLTPGHYCECCGRKLSLQERRALESAPALAHTPAVEAREHVSTSDRLVGVHFPDPAPAVAVAAPPVSVAPAAPGAGFIDPILEAHFAGQVPVGPAHAPAAPVVAAVVQPAGPRVAAPTTDWVAPSANVAPAGGVELYTDPAPHEMPPSHGDGDASFARCEVCSGPADDGDLCPTCRERFHALLEPPSPPAQSEPEPEAEPVTAASLDETPLAAPAPHVEQASMVATPSVHVVAQAATVASVSGAVDVPPAPAVVAAAPAAAPVKVETQAPAHVQASPVQPSPIQIKVRPPVAAQPAPEPAPSTPEAAARRPHASPASASPKAAPARVSSPPAAVAQPASSARKVAAIVAVAVALAAIGFPLGKLWLGHQETPAIVQGESEPAASPAPVVTPAPAPVPERPAAPVSAAPEPAVVAKAETPVPPTLKAQPVVPAAYKPVAANRAAVKPPVKTVRQPVAPTRPVAAAPVSSAVAVAPAPEVAPPAAVAAPEPKPEAPAAPIGPFYELRDVTETPRVLSKVEPQVPDDLRDRQLNEVVIVRVLVTQTGHATMVNLLRRSKAGASLDDAIVAAVRKWTFAPAKRRGEVVSCWYHVGVPVTKAN